MRTSCNLYFYFVLLFGLCFCTIEEIEKPPTENLVGSFERELLPLQVFSFNPGIPLEGYEKIGGELGGKTFEVGKGENGLVFFMVPELPPGDYLLKLQIGPKTMVWNVKVGSFFQNPTPIGDAFWEDYFAGSRVIQDSLVKHPELRYQYATWLEWTGFFKALFNDLTSEQKNTLSKIIQQNRLEKFASFQFELPMDENCLDANYSVFFKNFQVETESERNARAQLIYLPASPILDALKAFVADVIWKYSMVIELSRMKVLNCPILRDISFQTMYGKVDEKPILFNPGDSLVFKLEGEYIRLNSSDASLGMEGLGQYAILIFEEAKYQRNAHAEWISKYRSYQKLSYPFLPDFSFSYSTSPSIFRPLEGFTFQIQSISNPQVFLSNQVQKGNQLFLTFDRMQEGAQEFQFTMSFSQEGHSVTKNLKGRMPEVNELILDLYFDRGTANLSVLGGQGPFEIRWSNGVMNETMATFPAGDHFLTVTDAKGLEKKIEFKVPEFGTVKDREGNEYQTVKIGDRWWMAENLRNTIRENGKPIEHRPSWPAWNPGFPADFDHAAYSYYDNLTSNDARYGKLYNIHAFEGGICPDGWGLPSNEDFLALIEHLGGEDEVGRKLKSRSNWKETIFNSTNESGFNAKPGGRKFYNNSYEKEEQFVGWWVKPVTIPNRIAYLEAGSNQLIMKNLIDFYFQGHYIRCIQND